MRVLLINPNFDSKGFAVSSPPLGIAILASVLEENGIHCDVIDPIPMGITFQKAVEKSAQYDIAGITCITPTRFWCEDLVNHIKKINPDVTTIVGGPHVSVFDAIWMNKIKNTDIVIRGEGEKNFLEICQGKPLEDIKGITYRNGENIIRNDDNEQLVNLDTLPIAAYYKFPLDKYAKLGDMPLKMTELKHIGIITSRGCPFNCVFCATPDIFGKRWKSMSSERVIKEIDFLINKFGIQYIRFLDDHFTTNKKRTIGICKLIIEKEIKIVWRCQSRIDTIDEETISWLSKAGCHEIEFGVESGSQRLIDEFINKKIRIENIQNLTDLCRKYNISTKGYFIIGFPGENFQDIEMSAKTATLFDYVSVSPLQVYPGTSLFSQTQQRKAFERKVNDRKNIRIYYNKNVLKSRLLCYYIYACQISARPKMTFYKNGFINGSIRIFSAKIYKQIVKILNKL